MIRSIVEMCIWDNYAIRDTNIHDAGQIDLSQFKEVVLLVNNTMDQDVKLLFNFYGTAFAQYNGTAWDTALDDIVITKNKGWCIVNTHDGAKFLQYPLKTLGIKAQASVAPTIGGVSIRVWGLPN